jgi:hypothetical protein
LTRYGQFYTASARPNKARIFLGGIMTTRRDFSAPPLAVSLLYVGVVGALITTHLMTSSSALAAACYNLVIVMLPVAAIVSWRYLRPPTLVWQVATATATAFLVANIASTFGDDPQSDSAAIVESVALLIGQALTFAFLVAFIRRRLGRDVAATIADAGIMALAGWMVVWVGLIQPTIEVAEDSLIATVAQGLYQPLSIGSIFLLAILLYADTFRSPAVWMLSGVIVFTVAGDITYALEAAGHTGEHHVVGDTLYRESAPSTNAGSRWRTEKQDAKNSVEQLQPAGAGGRSCIW